MKPIAMLMLLLTSGAGTWACAPSEREPETDERAAVPELPPDAVTRAALEPLLDSAFARAATLADSIDDVLQPVPLLTPAEEATLRAYGNTAHLARARALGRRVTSPAVLDSLVEAGELVPLEDSTAHWVVRELDLSRPFVTPATHEALAELGRRFQQRLEDMGLPPFRIEVTSVLRTPQLQQQLRGENPNAAAGTSTHEFGTTVDIAYSAYGPPADAGLGDLARDEPWLQPYLDRFAALALEAAAARKSRELQAILGQVLRDAQNEGTWMVTLERQQPVYHITIASAPGG